MKNLISALSFFVFLSSFSLGYSQAVVSPIKMNVVYRALANPLRIAVSGWDNKDLIVTVSAGHKLTREENDVFMLIPSISLSNRRAIITVTGEMPDGSIANLGTEEFRIMSIPLPNPLWAGKRPFDRTISKKDVLFFAPLGASMQDDFNFNILVRVKSFTLLLVTNGTLLELTSNSNRLTSDMKTALARVVRGNTITFDDIIVKMPDGDTTIQPLVFKVTN